MLMLLTALFSASLGLKCDHLEREAELDSVELTKGAQKLAKSQEIVKGLQEKAEICSVKLMRAQKVVEEMQKEAEIHTAELRKVIEKQKMKSIATAVSHGNVINVGNYNHFMQGEELRVKESVKNFGEKDCVSPLSFQPFEEDQEVHKVSLN